MAQGPVNILAARLEARARETGPAMLLLEGVAEGAIQRGEGVARAKLTDEHEADSWR